MTPQNGARIVTTDSVPLFHPMYWQNVQYSTDPFAFLKENEGVRDEIGMYVGGGRLTNGCCLSVLGVTVMIGSRSSYLPQMSPAPPSPSSKLSSFTAAASGCIAADQRRTSDGHAAQLQHFSSPAITQRRRGRPARQRMFSGVRTYVPLDSQ